MTDRATLESVTAYVARYTYKPGARFTVSTHEHSYGFIAIMLIIEVPDAEHPGQLTRVVNMQSVEPGMPMEVLPQLIRELVRKAELHEIDEWLRLDGARVHEPHPELARTRLVPEIPRMKYEDQAFFRDDLTTRKT